MATKRKIQDFGEKIGGARKDYFSATGGFNAINLTNLTDAEKLLLLKKERIWPKPDYAGLVADGMPVEIAWRVKMTYDSIPNEVILNGMSSVERQLATLDAYATIMTDVRDIVVKARSHQDFTAAFDRYATRSEIEDGAIHKVAYRRGGRRRSVIGRLNEPLSADYESYMGRSAARSIKEEAFPEGGRWRKIAAKNKFSIRELVDSDTQETKWTITKPTGEGYDEYRAMATWVCEYYDKAKMVEDWKKATESIDGDFDSKEEAEGKLKELIEKRHPIRRKDKSEEEEAGVRPQLAKIRRTGPDYRKGEDATPEMFQKDFGFRGGEFGNWTSQEDRRQSLNHGYDALCDMARILKVPTKAIGLEGTLAIAFGSRGHGRALAHFEPGRKVINLTKMNGAGALAHEWWHAVDNFLSVKSGRGQVDYFSESKEVDFRIINTPYGDVQGEFVKMREGFLKRELTKAESLEQCDSQIKNTKVRYIDGWLRPADRKVQIDGVAALGEELVNKWTEIRLKMQTQTIDVPETCRLYKAIVGKVIPSVGRNTLVSLSDDIPRWRIIKEAIETDTVDQNPMAQSRLSKQANRTNYIRVASELDQSKAKPYWSTGRELSARAFESYIEDAVSHEGRMSEYLVHTTTRLKSCPQAEERESFNAIFRDKIAPAIQSVLGIAQEESIRQRTTVLADIKEARQQCQDRMKEIGSANWASDETLKSLMGKSKDLGAELATIPEDMNTTVKNADFKEPVVEEESIEEEESEDESEEEGSVVAMA